MNNRIVVFGDDHHNALGLLRMLGGRGFDVLLLVYGTVAHIATVSKYCQKYEVVNDLEEGIHFLLKNYTDKDNKAVLLFTADKFSEIANQHLDLLKDFFYVSGPSQQGVLAEIDDKFTMGEIAAECGITIPKTILIPRDPIEEVVVFPAIIKPCSPTYKDFKTIIVRNKKQLLKVAKSFIPEKRYVIQPFIAKESDGLVYGCRTWDGQTLLAGICIRSRWGDDGCGSFGYLTSEIPESVCVTGIERFLEKIDFRGLFSVEYALTKDNAYFYEFNLRNDGTSILFYNAGSNLALAFVNSCFGINEEVSVRVHGKQYLMHEILDEFNIYDRKVSRKQWLEDKEKVTLHFLYAPDDMKPFKSQMAQSKRMFIHHVISRMWINRMRLALKYKFKSRR